MTPFLCQTCGTQFAPSDAPPPVCPICEDERQYVGWKGQRWLTLAELNASRPMRIEIDHDLSGIGTKPAFAIDQRALVLPTAGPRVLWECVSAVTEEAVEQITRDGPIDLIAISHPHFYGSMVEWAQALGGVPILLHAADREWIMRPSPLIELWEGERKPLSDGVSLIRCGGHFEGSTVLHWLDRARPNGALFPGDALQVVSDRRHVTFMYSYPNYIPLHPDAVRRLSDSIAGCQFEDVFGYTWGRNIIGHGREAVDRSFDRYLAAIGVGEAA
ncbi:MAG: MBL fold metallo-hydrolase [Proteobacteria bacterium]|nr:MBL fold metallo-hydrolase [Pseudomonadota bacterium]